MDTTGQNGKGTIKSKDLNISSLFEDFYIVPNYQREYVWEDTEVRKLIDDVYGEYENSIDGNPVEYFIGSMVVCPREDGRYEVIDGQQRLTTFFIFFCALKEYFRSGEAQIPQDLGHKIAKMSINEMGDEVAWFRIELHYMEGQGILRTFSNPSEFKDLKIGQKSRSIDNLNTAYNVILDFLRETFEENYHDARKFYGYICNKVKIISVKTDSISRALKIFETINDRGVGLDSMDLLKNLLFIQVDGAKIEELRLSWQRIVDLLYNAKEKPLRFIRYFVYANFRVEKLYEDDVYTWFSSNKKLCGIENSPIEFVENLHSFAHAYVCFLQGVNIDGSPNRHLRNMKLLGGSSRQHLMLLLAAKDLPRSEFERFCEWTENLLCVYSIGRELGRAVEPRFAKWALEIRYLESEEDLLGFLVRRYQPEFEKFRQRFTLAFAEMRDDNIQKYRLKYILGKLYQSIQYSAFEKETDIDLMRFVEKGVEIEHIIPLTNNDGFKIEIMNSVEDYDYNVHMLGNLALIEKSINASISNNSIDKKKKGFRASDFLLTRALADPMELGQTKIDRALVDVETHEIWGASTIDARQNFYGKLALRVWGFDRLDNFSRAFGV